MIDQDIAQSPREKTQVRKPLRRQLLRSHLSIAMLGLIGLVVVFLLQLTLRKHTIRLTQFRAPAAQDSMEIVTGVQESLASLRGWIVSGDESFQRERLHAWDDVIDPAFGHLSELHRTAGDTSMYQDLQQVKRSLQRLRETQWWIEDVANTPGNQPLRVFYTDHLRPIGDQIFISITATIDLEKRHPAEGRHALLAAMADIRGFFTRSQNIPLQFIDQEGEIDTSELSQWLLIVERQLQFLIDNQDQLDDQQRQLVALIHRELSAYRALCDELIGSEDTQPWNVARYRLNTEAVPIANELTSLLEQLSDHHLTLMKSESARVSQLTNFIATLSILMTIILGIATAIISNWIAKRLSAPIVELTEASARLAAGDLDAPVHSNSDDELGILAQQFNEMRFQLGNESRALREAKDILQRSEELLQQVFSSAPVAMLMIDEQGKIVLTNHQAEKLFEYGDGRLVGHSIGNLLPENVREIHHDYQQSYRDDPTVRRMGAGKDLTAKTSRGSAFPVEIGLTPVRTNDELFTLCVVVDLTERKQQESLLIQSREDALRASRAKSDFLANMSHEIRTPMNAIIGLTDLVLNSSLDSLQRDYLETVSTSADSLLQIINDILDFSKIEAGKLVLENHDFAFRELIGDTLKTFAVKAHEKGLELSCRIARNVPDILVGDSGRTRQVILNLVGNAIKFTPAGNILVEVRVDSGEAIQPDQIKVRISVTDTGVGIPKDKLHTIFENFEQADTSTTRQFGGTGLGLSIASRLAKAMGGDIQVESELDHGSTFHFTAVFQRGETMTITPWRHLIKKLESTHVLIVDDNEMNRVILRDMLETHGINVDSACSGSEALQTLRNSVHQGNAYHIVVSDLNMPEMDGYQLASTLADSNEYYSQIPFLILTSSSYDGDLNTLNTSNVSGMLVKPVKQSELYELIVRSLHIRDEVEIKDLGVVAKDPDIDPNQGTLNILLAEDSIPNQKLALAILNAAGHRTTVVENGREAVKAACNRIFDVVLMDIQMPEMDGIEATASIRAHDRETGRHTPIVALTAHALIGDREKCIEAGMDSYVSKPVNPRGLFKAIEVATQKNTPDTSPELPQSAAAIESPKNSDIPWNVLLQNAGGATNELREIIKTHAVEIRASSQQLSQSVSQWDAQQTLLSAQQLKKAIDYFHQSDTVQIVEQLERKGKAGDATDSLQAFNDLLPRIESLLTTIDEYLDQVEPA
ncbi:response regulator [Stieleria sp. JC731]|uniref:response regulator n=1 Tax=Pirellulaceae TaxID=2691357 RepID=UPI001E3C11C4|nr:response regulator [Stieleria sp. JC731]MCC9600062.1 response regulator [Stieleria sp. JC731]